MPSHLPLSQPQEINQPRLPLGDEREAKMSDFGPVPRRFNRLTKWYPLTDLLGILIGFACASIFAAMLAGIWPEKFSQLSAQQFTAQRFMEISLVATAVLLWLLRNNHYRLRIPLWQEVKKIALAMVIAMLADGFLQFAYKADSSRIWLVAGWGMATFSIIGLRVALRHWFKQRGVYDVPCLLIGGGETAKRLRNALNSEASLGYVIKKHIRDLPQSFLSAGCSWQSLCELNDARYVMIALDGAELAASESALAELMREDVAFSVTPPVHHLPVQGMASQYFLNHDTLLMKRTHGLHKPMASFIKRSFDIVVSSLALLGLGIPMLIVAFKIRKDGGSATFSHQRVGQHGKPFMCLKFRSMRVDSQEALKEHLANSPKARAEWEESQKLENDPRVTKIGDFIRRSSIDELPQLINVLKGEMSIVGPRPITESEIKKYRADIAYYMRVKPGMSGLWQVSGRSDVSYAQRVAMDGWYVRNWSLWHDIAIILKTFPVLLKREGAV